MSNIAIIGTYLTVAAIALLVIPFAVAKNVTDPPAAPIPIQMLTGKNIFISNTESTADIIFGVPNLTYNTLYAHMKSLEKYELVSAPADAHLIFNINFVVLLYPQLRLVVLDPKTHVVLWTFTEQVQPWNFKKTGRKNVDQAMARLVEDVKTLTTPPASTPETPVLNK